MAGEAERLPVRIPKQLRVVRDKAGGAARLYIDGELFPFATVDGFTVHPQKTQMPCVSVSIAAWSVVVEDSVDGAPDQATEVSS